MIVFKDFFFFLSLFFSFCLSEVADIAQSRERKKRDRERREEEEGEREVISLKDICRGSF